MKKKSPFPYLVGCMGFMVVVIFSMALFKPIRSREAPETSPRPLSLSIGKAEIAPLSKYPPDYKQLVLPGPHQIWALPVEKKTSSSPELIKLGGELYQKKCASCHGKKGQGDGPITPYLVTPPMDFTLGQYKFQTTDGPLPSDEDIFRSISAGFPLSGMPSFSHLSDKDRFALVFYLKTLSPLFKDPSYKVGDVIDPGKALPPTAFVLAKGKRLYMDKKLRCFECHGEKGRGDGVAAATLKDAKGRQIHPAAFGLGITQFKSGSRPEDIYRVILLGISPSRMPPHNTYLGKEFTKEDFKALARYVEHLARKREQEIREGWKTFVQTWESRYPRTTTPELMEDYPSRYSLEVSQKFAKVSKEKALKEGCLSCHQGVHIIQGDSEKMGESILAMAGGELGRTCVVCHEGNPQGHTKEMAHQGVFSDPGSMWVVSFGKGCGKCHVGHQGLHSLQDVPFPTVVRGPMVVNSKRFDPSGSTGHSHVYRLQRSMMSLEFGKATYTLQVTGFLNRDQFIYADFAMGDPLGPMPLVGSQTYKDWVMAALKTGEMKRVDRTKAFPDFYNLPPEWNKQKPKYLVDYYRKACGRCHVWHPGRPLEGEYRGSGCSSCHVFYSREGLYEGQDPTIPKNKGGHPVMHKITAKIPYQQCSRCHMSLYKHENIPQSVKCKTGYGPEVHIDRGIECIDCHTSIDMHGDGNIYYSLQFQVETRCSDCHGTRNLYPWELPVGDYRVAGKARGVFPACKTCNSPVEKGFCPQCKKKTEVVEYLLTSRSNPRVNVFRKGKEVWLLGKYDGKLHKSPLLKDSPLTLYQKVKNLEPYHSKPDMVQKHQNVECSGCHSRQTSKCYICHLFREKAPGADYLASPTRFDPRKGKIVKYYKTPGSFKTVEVPRVKGEAFWGLGAPEILKTLRGTYRPFQPVCYTYTVLQKKVPGGDEPPFEKTVNQFHKMYVGKTYLGTPNAHEFTDLPRNCKDCHIERAGKIKWEYKDTPHGK